MNQRYLLRCQIYSKYNIIYNLSNFNLKYNFYNFFSVARIIPFVAADALDDKKEVISREESHPYGLFSPPTKTEGTLQSTIEAQS